MSKADIAALLERVRQATGPDREIDALIHIAFVQDYGAHMELHPARYIRFEDVWRKNRADHLNHANNVADWWKCPIYTASLDAIVALIERELPDYRVQLFKKASGGWIARLNSPRYDLAAPHERDRQHPWESPNGALALCAAFLAAKLALSDHSQT